MYPRLIASLVLGALPFAAAAHAQREALPDLVVRGVAPGAEEVPAGDTLRVGLTVRNRGLAPARRSVAAIYLSKDGVKGRGDRRLRTRRIPPLAAGERARRRPRVRIPGDADPGSYRLLVCADVRRAVRESRERNNCKAGKRRIRVPGGPAGRHDRTPPIFAGLEAATTCIPGPIGGGIESSYHLRWSPAKDNVTAQKEIVYDVFQSSAAKGQDFGKPDYTSKPGATAFSTPPLSSDKTWYFVVRARDRAGNRDANRVERDGQNLCN